MVSKALQEEVTRLRSELHHHNYLYYVEAAPRISDREFDRMMARLQEIETQHPELITPDSPTQRVGGQPLEGFKTVKHAVAMLSIANTYSYDEVREWDARIRKALNPGEPVRYVVELKSTAWPSRSATRRGSSFKARLAATASGETTSRRISARSAAFP